MASWSVRPSRFSPVPNASARLRLITCFGLGYCKPASGTWGSLPPALYAALMVVIWATPGTDMQLAWYLPLAMICVLFSVACVRDGDLAEAVFNKKDAGQVVADETAGMALTLLLLPPALINRFGLLMVLWAFVMFRIFDIIKPWPARQIQSVPGGWGVLLDDHFAALYAVLVAWLWLWLWF